MAGAITLSTIRTQVMSTAIPEAVWIVRFPCACSTARCGLLRYQSPVSRLHRVVSKMLDGRMPRHVQLKVNHDFI